METSQGRTVEPSRSKIQNLDFTHFQFRDYISDHMLIADFKNGSWHAPQLLPYSNFEISLAALALHYGQTVFEGMKAFKMDNGQINIFRIEKHYQRFVNSSERMCMAVVPKDFFVNGLKQLIAIDRAWVPAKEGTA